MMKKGLIACLMITFLLGQTNAWAVDENRPSGGAMILDLPIRVIGIPVIVMGTAFFIVALPFTWPSGSVGDSWDALVIDPVQFTFVRPLGKFEDWRELEEDTDHAKPVTMNLNPVQESVQEPVQEIPQANPVPEMSHEPIQEVPQEVMPEMSHEPVEEEVPQEVMPEMSYESVEETSYADPVQDSLSAEPSAESTSTDTSTEIHEAEPTAEMVTP